MAVCREKSLEYLFLPIVLGMLVTFMIIVSPITLWEGCRFYLYQLTAILLPGLVILECLKISGLSVLEKCLAGYLLGFAFVTTQYFVFAALGQQKLLMPFQVAVAGGIAGILWRRFERKRSLQAVVLQENKALGKNVRREMGLLCMCLFLVFGLRFVIYYGLNLFPTEDRSVTFPTQDILFYVGNAISAQKGFPLEEFRFAGQPFKYHYFGSIQLAVAARVTGISILKLELCLNWISSVILYISAIYLLLRRLRVSFLLRLLGMGLILFTTGLELLVYVAYQYILYRTPFGYDIGLAFGLLTIWFLYGQHTQKVWSPGLFFGSLLAFFLCEGSKAPVAVVILFLSGCVLGVWLLTPGRRIWAIVYGFFLTVLFVVVFFGFVSDGMSTVTTNVTGLRFTLTGHLYECGLGKLYFDLTAMGVPGILGKLLILALFYFGCNMVAYFLLAVFGRKLICSGPVKILSFEGGMLAASLFGLFMTLCTKQQGNSQMYFAMVSFPLAVILSVKLWNDLGSPKGRIVGKLFYLIFGVLTFCSFFSFVKILAPSFQTGAEKLAGCSDFGNGSNSLTYEEMQAYDWVREHTWENALCVTNVILEKEQYESFIVGVCTERQMYMEGWRYVAGYVDEDVIFARKALIGAFFAGDDEAVRRLEADGVDYVVFVKRYRMPGMLKDKDLPGEKMFENNAVTVYALP